MVAARFMVALIGLVLASSTARAEDDDTDTTGHGAVLCIHMIYVSLLATGDKCFPGKDPEIKDALRRSIEDIERFIQENSETTQKQLNETRERYRKGIYEEKLICERERNVYEGISRQNANDIKTETERLLSVPRKPKFNPCL